MMVISVISLKKNIRDKDYGQLNYKITGGPWL